MADQKKTFSDYSKKEWLEHISGSLKKGSMEDLQWRITEDLQGVVFAHRDDFDSTPQPIRKNQPDNSWVTAQVLDCWPDSDESLEAFSACKLLDGSSFKWEETNTQKTWILCFSTWELFLEYSLTANWPDHRNEEEGDSRIILAIEHVFSMDIKTIRNHLKEKPWFNGLLISIPRYEGKSPVFLQATHARQLVDWITPFAADTDLINWIFDLLHFEYVISRDFLFEIANIRASRLIYYNIQKSFGVPVRDGRILGLLDLDHLASTDPDRLILATAASLAAVIAGVKMVLLASGTSMQNNGLPLLRLAGNIQWLLEYESGMAAVLDPAAGSYAIENLTQQIATESWELFRNRL